MSQKVGRWDTESLCHHDYITIKGNCHGYYPVWFTWVISPGFLPLIMFFVILRRGGILFIPLFPSLASAELKCSHILSLCFSCCALSGCRMTEHHANFHSRGWRFSGISDLLLWKDSKFQLEINQTAGICWFLLQASISDVSSKEELRQKSNSSNVPALQLGLVVISMLRWHRWQIPNKIVLEMSASPWYYPFQIYIAALNCH